MTPISSFMTLTADSLKSASMERSPPERCLPEAPWVRIEVNTLDSRLNWYGTKG